MTRYYTPLSLLGAVFHSWILRFFPSYALETAEHKVLLQYSHFYAQLSNRGKARFIRRVISFMAIKEFVPGGAYRIHAEVPVIIAGIYVQITWGVKTYSLERFTRFQVFEETFVNTRDNQTYAAMISSRDTISMGVKPLLSGILDSTDGVNPAMAIMVKAMEIDLLYGSIYDYHMADYYEKWKEIADIHREKLIEVSPAMEKWNIEITNRELLSLGIVRFFENPTQLKQNVPLIYETLSVLLNIDPFNSRDNDFMLDRKIARERGVKKVSLRKEYNIKRKDGVRYFPWVLGWAVAGVVIGPAWTYMNFLDTLISFRQLVAISTVPTALTFLLMVFCFARPRAVPWQQVALFCLFFVLPMASGLFLQINRIAPGKSYEQKYPILAMEYQREKGGVTGVTYILPNNNIPERMRTFKERSDVASPINAVFIFKNGLLGFPVLRDVRIE